MNDEKINTDYDWTVVGAGPAGIAAVGKLLDHGVASDRICWVDPYFQVGDLGRRWQHVPSNTKVSLFLRFLSECRSFAYAERPHHFVLDGLEPQATCPLKYIVEPLQWVSNHLKDKVRSLEAFVTSIDPLDGGWKVHARDAYITTKKLVLAVGADAKKLAHAGPEVIPLDVAFHPERLLEEVAPHETIGVFGSSHSAVLAMANLVKTKSSTIINFYRSPHRYAVYYDDWILHDNTGLKGFAADWAKQHLDEVIHPKLRRMLVSDQKFHTILASCHKVVYGIGFERRQTPFAVKEYCEKTGVIVPGLFGIGIAFPQGYVDRQMNFEYRVGLWKFMDYLNEVMPLWFSSR